MAATPDPDAAVAVRPPAPPAPAPAAPALPPSPPRRPGLVPTSRLLDAQAALEDAGAGLAAARTRVAAQAWLKGGGGCGAVPHLGGGAPKGRLLVPGKDGGKGPAC